MMGQLASPPDLEVEEVQEEDEGRTHCGPSLMLWEMVTILEAPETTMMMMTMRMRFHQ